MFDKKRRRSDNNINAGTMADIAFLLLIFFLVTTTILTDQGLMVKLPPWDPDQEPIEQSSKNVLKVLINAQNQLQVEGQNIQIDQLRPKIKEFIINPNKDPNLASSPAKAIVSLQNDRGTSYRTYLEVYNELKGAYNDLWDQQSRVRYGSSYPDLPEQLQKNIRNEIPLIISEAEPTEYGDSRKAIN